MWVEQKRSWIETVFLGGFALPRIWTRALTVTGVSILVTIIYERVSWLHYSLTAIPFTLVGLPLGIFLGFRNNAAYDRFWEGRRAWGQLVNTTRSFTRQVLTFVENDEETRAQAVHLAIAYVHALRHHLRDTSPTKALVHVLGQEESSRFAASENVPIAVLRRLGDVLAEARRKGNLDSFHAPVLEASLTIFTDQQGICERIKSTPIPFSYTVLLHRIVASYCALLPFGLMDSIHWATPFVVLTISYCFFGLDAIGDELEQPFGLDVNDLPLKSISRMIERNLRESLGEELPPKVTAKRGVLS